MNQKCLMKGSERTIGQAVSVGKLGQYVRTVGEPTTPAGRAARFLRCFRCYRQKK